MTPRFRLIKPLLVGLCLQALTGGTSASANLLLCCRSGPTVAGAISRGSVDPRRVGAGLVPAPIRAGRKPRRTNHLRERRTRGSKPARHRLFARFFAENLHLHSAELRGRHRSGGTVQLAAGTQTFLEVQSLRSWAGAGGDHFQRDTFYVRAISAYWAEKYFPTLTYLGPR